MRARVYELTRAPDAIFHGHDRAAHDLGNLRERPTVDLVQCIRDAVLGLDAIEHGVELAQRQARIGLALGIVVVVMEH